MSFEQTMQDFITYLDAVGQQSQSRYTYYEQAGFPELFRESYLLHNHQREPDVGVPMLRIKAEILQMDIYALAASIVEEGEGFKILSSIIGSYRALAEHLLNQQIDSPELWPGIIEGLKTQFQAKLVEEGLT